MKSSSTRVGQLITLAGAVLIASMTLVPHPELTRESAATPLSCLLCGDYGVVDVFLNILLFIPFGLGLRLIGNAATSRAWRCSCDQPVSSSCSS